MNGVNRNNNATRIDGALSVFLWLPHHTAYIPPAETIETVNIATNNFDAEQGLAGGAAITVITKSGTNDFHGSAWAFHDNAVLQAKNFFNTAAKPKNINNIDGVTLGGPIRRNKLFFFFGWEGVHERQGATNTFTVPTADQRQGDFSRYNTVDLRSGDGSRDRSRTHSFPGNIIPLNRQSAISRKIQDLIPLPNLPGVASNFLASGSQRLDKNNLRHQDQLEPEREPYHLGQVFDHERRWWGALRRSGRAVERHCVRRAATSATAHLRTQVATVGSTYIFSPTFLWDGLFGWTRQGQAITGFDYGNFIGRELGIPGVNGDSQDVRDSGAPVITIAGLYEFPERHRHAAHSSCTTRRGPRSRTSRSTGRGTTSASALRAFATC